MMVMPLVRLLRLTGLRRGSCLPGHPSLSRRARAERLRSALDLLSEGI